MTLGSFEDLKLNKVYYKNINIKNKWYYHHPIIPIRKITKEEYLEANKEDSKNWSPLGWDMINSPNAKFYEVKTD